MNAKHVLSLVMVAVLAGGGGWFLSNRQHQSNAAPDANAPAPGGKIYSCSMHPQIRNTKPGRCPICLMELAPLGSGQSAAQLPEGSVQLSASVINVINVQTSEVKRQPLARTLRVAGIIDDNDMRHRRLSAYIDGRIEKLFINSIGAEVTAGQPLATFYSPTLLAKQALSLAKVADCFQTVVGCDQVPLSKPAPDGVLLACARLGVTPQETLLVGDSRFDEGAASAAGTGFVWFKSFAELRIPGLG